MNATVTLLSTVKKCTTCQEIKNADEFRLKGRTCKSCTSIKQRAWVKKNKKKILEKRRNYIRLPHARILRKLAHIKRRCVSRGLAFNLLPEDLVVPVHCPVLGILLNNDPRSPFCATIDKIKPELGYIKGNVVVVSKRANQIKSDASLDEIRKVIDYYAQLRV